MNLRHLNSLYTKQLVNVQRVYFFQSCPMAAFQYIIFKFTMVYAYQNSFLHFLSEVQNLPNLY